MPNQVGCKAQNLLENGPKIFILQQLLKMFMGNAHQDIAKTSVSLVGTLVCLRDGYRVVVHFPACPGNCFELVFGLLLELWNLKFVGNLIYFDIE